MSVVQIPLQKLIAARNALELSHALLLHSTALSDDECNAIDEARRDIDRFIRLVLESQQLEVTP
jgi:hypothetical protein